MSVKNAASILAIIGASGSGKSAFLKQQVARLNPPRLLVWDPMREYAEFGEVVTQLAKLGECVSTAGNKRGKFALVFQCAADEKQRARQFDVFCGLALAAGNCMMIVEELKFVTRPGFAPVRWSQCTLTGRHKGLQIIGVTQRPASIDKDFLGNATVIHVGRLVYPEDRRAVSRAMSVPEAEIEGLAPLHYIEKNMQSGERRAGKVTFS